MSHGVHVEVEVKEDCPVSLTDIENWVRTLLRLEYPLLRDGPLELSAAAQKSSPYAAYTNTITVSDVGFGSTISNVQADLMVHVFSLSETEPDKDFLDGEEEVHAVEQWELPSKILTGLWNSIVVSPDIKESLLGYCDTSLAFSDADIDPNIISWNRMALLYGPPGTGKTSLCKALAQKAYIRSIGIRYTSGVLLEINAHSLFSKWFSESGKLVMKMFEHISDIAEDLDCFVCILIDEVESLTRSRSAASSGNEPGDAIRVVNAVLTALDNLRRQPNVLVLCTSNMIEGIDAAFRDRLDLCIHVGEPGAQARRLILRSCFVELRNKGILVEEPGVPIDSCWSETGEVYNYEGREHPYLAKFEAIVARTEGLSGRALRKLALRAHAQFIRKPTTDIWAFTDAVLSTLARDRDETATVLL